MAPNIEKVAVVGVGNVGSLVATLLHENGFDVLGVDQRPRRKLPFPIEVADISDNAAIARTLDGRDAVVSCLPYDLNLAIARIAHERGVHYFDLTEDVETTRAIRDMSNDSQGIMAPQCGLAPGFIGIVGASLTQGFDDLRSIELRVGALPLHPSGLLGYAFNWSPEGVVNEYLNECDVIKEGRRISVPAMGQLETVFIHGLRLEAFTTSGGLATMCETYEGQVQELNYKTLRYVGHCQLMNFFFHELHMKEDRERAGRILVNAKPPVSDDTVFVHAAVEGHKDGRLFREEFVQAYLPKEIAGREWRAISWTTAASVCAVIEMVSNGTLPGRGFLKQEEIPFQEFCATRGGSLFDSAE